MAPLPLYDILKEPFKIKELIGVAPRKPLSPNGLTPGRTSLYPRYCIKQHAQRCKLAWGAPFRLLGAAKEAPVKSVVDQTGEVGKTDEVEVRFGGRT